MINKQLTELTRLTMTRPSTLVPKGDPSRTADAMRNDRGSAPAAAVPRPTLVTYHGRLAALDAPPSTRNGRAATEARK